MHLEVEQLRALATLAEELSFTKAARRLGVAQPALSARIRRMERRLGRQLVERSTRSVRITAAGLDLLARAEPMLAEAEAAGTAAVGTAAAGTGAQLSRGSSG